jgi:ABC-type glycerol-3-phosphate transport system substrate-binding protein
MRLRIAAFFIALLVTGCGQSQTTAALQADMPARTWQYYVAHPQEIEAMQKICGEWSAGTASAAAEPAVVTTNCRAAAFAKSQRQITR